MLKTWGPLVVAAAVLWADVGGLTLVSVRRNDGHLVYALDDAYIHMAMARSLARDGTWGVTPEGFSSTSSSLLWTLLLGGVYRIAGPAAAAPLVMNVVLATGVLAASDLILRRAGLGALPRLGLLAGTLFLTPLPALIFIGMEHTAHVLLAILFIATAARVLARPPGIPIPRAEGAALAVLSGLLVMARFEGIFLILAVTVLLAARRRFGAALVAAAFGALPIVLYGFLSVAKGWSFFPNSILLKGNAPNLLARATLGHFFYWTNLWAFPRNAHLAGLALLLGWLAWRRWRLTGNPWAAPVTMAALLIAAMVLQVTLARTGWFFRYEAYLVAASLVTLGLFAATRPAAGPEAGRLARRRATWAVTAVLSVLAAVPLLVRGAEAQRRIPGASTNIYQQQYQMGLFLHAFYQGQAVAANDIGAINYLADIRCLDLWGLSTREVARLKLERAYTTAAVRRLAADKGARIAILYDSWLRPYGGVPPEWTCAARWRIPDNIVCGDDTVSFYAVDTAALGPLREHLAAFTPRLPRAVEVLPSEAEGESAAPGRFYPAGDRIQPHTPRRSNTD